MSDTLPQFFRLNIPFLVVLGLALIAGLAAWWQYRYRFSTEGTAVTVALIALRALVVFAVLLLLFAPVLTIFSVKKQTARIAVYVDNSASMSQNRLDSTRWERTERIIQNLPRQTPDDVRLSWFTFNQSVQAVRPDSVVPSSGGTSFGALLQHIRKNKFPKAIILSDGLNTDTELGLDAFTLESARVFTVGIGRGQGGRDIFIADVIRRPAVYASQEQKVEVRVRATGLKSARESVVTLYMGGKRIGRRQVNMGADGALQNLIFTYTPEKPGMIRFAAQVDTLSGEINTINNRVHFVQKVLKNRLRIALFASAPGYESKFIRLLLQAYPDMNLQTFVEKSPGVFYSGHRFDPRTEYDLIIFVDFPGRRTPQALLEQIRAYLGRGSAGLLVFMGRQTLPERLSIYEPWLPFKTLPRTGRSGQLNVVPPPEQSHPLLNVFDDIQTTDRFWNTVPPVFVSLSGGKAKEKTISLLSGRRAAKQQSLILLYEEKGLRNALFMGEGYWRWHFLLQRDNELRTGYGRFLHGLVRWLGDRTGNKPVVLQAAKQTVHPGEAVELKIFLNDAAFHPIRDGEVTLQVTAQDQSFEIEARRDSSGVFLSRFVPVHDGAYKITAKGYRQGQFLGQSEVQLEVVPLNREFLRLDLDRDFLQKLAAYNNGFYISENGIDSLQSVLVNENPLVREEQRFDLWYAPWLLAFILIVLTSEWIIRKKTGLV